MDLNGDFFLVWTVAEWSFDIVVDIEIESTIDVEVESTSDIKVELGELIIEAELKSTINIKNKIKY